MTAAAIGIALYDPGSEGRKGSTFPGYELSKRKEGPGVSGRAKKEKGGRRPPHGLRREASKTMLALAKKLKHGRLVRARREGKTDEGTSLDRGEERGALPLSSSPPKEKEALRRKSALYSVPEKGEGNMFVSVSILPRGEKCQTRLNCLRKKRGDGPALLLYTKDAKGRYASGGRGGEGGPSSTGAGRRKRGGGFLLSTRGVLSTYRCPRRVP